MKEKIEDKLKAIIIDRYGSMVEFAKAIDIPNPTLASIMSRGIHRANVTNIIKICKALGISTDELAKNKIVPVTIDPKNELQMKELRDILKYYKMNLKAYEGCTIDGCPSDKTDAEILLDAMDLALDFIKRHKERTK